MKTIEIEDVYPEAYTSRKTLYANCVKDYKGRFKTVGYFYSCREEVVDEYREHVLDKTTSDTTDIIVYSKTKARTNKESDVFYSNSKRCMNTIEDIVKWKKSKIYRVKSPYITGLDHIYLFRGSKKWSISPHILSLYTLIMRLGVPSLYSNVNRVCSEVPKDLDRFVCIRTALPILSNVNNIFKRNPFYLHKKTDAFGQGFDKMLMADTLSKKTNNKLRKILHANA